MKYTTIRRSSLGALVLFFSLAAFTTRAQIPVEVDGLAWCPDTLDCLDWSSVDGATSYAVYRGAGADLAGLLDGAVESCRVGSFAATSTGSLPDDPATPGTLLWFLVTASNLSGEGPAGGGSGGPRVIDSSGDCIAGATLVINEVDYDQPGTDVGEFVEIHNPGGSAVDLGGLVLAFVNGLNSSEYARVNLADAGPVLASGGYLVVGTPQIIAALPPATPNVTFASSSNNLQNGSPDGLALLDTGTGTLLDALSYEGSIAAALLDGQPVSFNLVEGTAATAQDSNSVQGSMTRLPDGTDTDDADTDWGFSPLPSPGAPNPAP